jgi:hypothetical protein
VNQIGGDVRLLIAPAMEKSIIRDIERGYGDGMQELEWITH